MKSANRSGGERSETSAGKSIYTNHLTDSLAMARTARQYAELDFIDRFSHVLYDFASKLSSPDNAEKLEYNDLRELTFAFNNLLNRLNREDVNILIEIANRLYPELKSQDKNPKDFQPTY